MNGAYNVIEDTSYLPGMICNNNIKFIMQAEYY